MAFKAFSAVAGALADFWLRMLHVFKVSDSDPLETLGFTNISGPAAGALWLHVFKVSDSDTLETVGFTNISGPAAGALWLHVCQVSDSDALQTHGFTNISGLAPADTVQRARQKSYM